MDRSFLAETPCHEPRQFSMSTFFHFVIPFLALFQIKICRSFPHSLFLYFPTMLGGWTIKSIAVEYPFKIIPCSFFSCLQTVDVQTARAHIICMHIYRMCKSSRNWGKLRVHLFTLYWPDGLRNYMLLKFDSMY